MIYSSYISTHKQVSLTMVIAHVPMGTSSPILACFNMASLNGGVLHLVATLYRVILAVLVNVRIHYSEYMINKNTALTSS